MTWDPEVRLRDTGNREGTWLGMSKRIELDREMWADLDRIEYNFLMIGNGGAIAGPFMFGRAFEAPPQPTFAVVTEKTLDGLNKCSSIIRYDEELLPDPTFSKLRSQIPSVTDHFAIDSSKRTPFVLERFHFIANEEPFPVSGAEDSLKLDDRFNLSYPVVPNIGQWGLEQFGWTGRPFFLDQGGQYESGWGLQCRIDTSTFFPFSFPGGPNFYTQYMCLKTGAFVPVMGRINPGDTIVFSIYGWASTTLTNWNRAIIFYDQSGAVHSQPLSDFRQVSTSRTKVTWEVTAPVELSAFPSGLPYWFSISLVLTVPTNIVSVWTAQIDRASIKVTNGPYTFGNAPPLHATIGVAEWIRDDNDMYVGANLWLKARSMNSAPTDVQTKASVTFKGVALKGYSSVHFLEQKTAPTEVVLK